MNIIISFKSTTDMSNFIAGLNLSPISTHGLTGTFVKFDIHAIDKKYGDLISSWTYQ